MILSVPHTGTRSIKALTGHTGIHVHAPDKEILASLTEHVIAPLRDPWSVYVSFYSRRGTGHGTKVSMEHAWERMAYWHERLDIFYVPVDVEPELQRKRLSEYLGRELGEWPHEGHFPSKEPPYKDLSWIYDLPMVREFYEAPSSNP